MIVEIGSFALVLAYGLRFLTIDREPLERLRQWVNAGPEAE